MTLLESALELASKLESALELASKGFHVFPVEENKKFPPLFKGFPTLATTDPEQVKKWWKNQNHNIGISTTRYNGTGALIAVDVDKKYDGENALVKLELEGKEFPKTFEQKTPGGGRHIVYFTDKPVSQRDLAAGINIRSDGGYVLGAGSVIDGVKYEATDFAVTEAPKWLVAKQGEPKEKIVVDATPLEGIKSEESYKRAKHYLMKECKPAISGDRHAKAYRDACIIKDMGVDSQTNVALMLEHWKSEPELEVEELTRQVESAYVYGKDPVGITAPETQFEPIKNDPEKNYLEKMNDDFAVIFEEGGYSILHETVDEKGRKKRNFMREDAFKLKFRPFTIQQEKGRATTFAHNWLEWKGRREYKGLCFAPEREPRNGYYNLWRGFSTTPLDPKKATPRQLKGLEMFMEHGLKNVCGGDRELWQWLLGYFAHMIQKPFERPLTTIVFRGSKGVGKNALIERIGRLVSDHYRVAHDGRYLTSNFNGHLDSCLLLVLDEAFWSGDKAAEGKLKGLTTAPEIMIEKKGKEPYVVDNLVRIVVIGNEDWLVPASYDERRYAVFQVGDGRKQDTRFFKEMREMLDNEGGNRLLLHFLKTFDLTKVDVNVAPSTQALMEQKVSSLDPFYQWWVDCLHAGRVIASEFGDTWQETLSKQQFRLAFRSYVKERQIHSRVPTDQAMSRQLSSCCPSTVKNQKKKEGQSYMNVYRFPTLEVARKEWETFIGHIVEWE